LLRRLYAVDTEKINIDAFPGVNDCISSKFECGYCPALTQPTPQEIEDAFGPVSSTSFI